MSIRWRGSMPWLIAGLGANVAVILGATMVLSQGEGDHKALAILAAIALGGAVALCALAWTLMDRLVARAARRLAAEIRAIAHGGTRTEVRGERYRLLAPLPDAIGELVARLIEARRRLDAGLEGATRQAEENAARLAAILNDLHEGVLVCNLRHQVVLYNQVAIDMLAECGPVGLSRSLFETLARAPVAHMVAMLTNRPDLSGRAVPFLAGSADGRLLLQARMTLIREAGAGGVGGYVVTLVDAGPQVAALTGREALLSAVAEEVAAPLHRLAAAEGSEAVRREADLIGRAVDRLVCGQRRLLTGWWPMTDLLSSDLFAFVQGRLGPEEGAEGAGLVVTVTGLPVWLHAESQSLILALETLIRRIAAETGRAGMDLGAGEEADAAWIEILWRGAEPAPHRLEEWLAAPLVELGGITLRDVFRHHSGDDPHWVRRDLWVGLRLPLARGVAMPVTPRSDLPNRRPEFYDLSLLAQARDTGGMGGDPLRALTYVVFDTETTGLSPSGGDRIVQIGAVRVVNGRILSGETFSRIVNPGRPIPAESVRFHGITDDMARDKPPLAVVLPQFKAFVADAVLVAHNAAFDLKFLRLGEREGGVVFDNPVMDTMILSAFLDGPHAGHSLDDICDRLGIGIADRHTALGDALVTAAVLLRQINALEMRGIATFDQAVKALDLTMTLHQRLQAL